MRIRNYEALTNHGNIRGRKAVCDILECGLQAADPYYNTLRLIQIENGKLSIGCSDFEPINAPKSGEDIYDLKDIDRIFVSTKQGSDNKTGDIQLWLDVACFCAFRGAEIACFYSSATLVGKINSTARESQNKH